MESTDLRGSRRDYRVRWAARSWVPMAVGLALAGTLLGCASTPMSGGGHQQSRHPASSPGDAVRTVSASRSPATGKAYPFKLFIHCGVPVVDFGGRAWRPVAPVPGYPGPRPVNGTSTYTGYVAGTMTLVNARTLRFAADESAVASPFSVVFEPLTARVTRYPCLLPGVVSGRELCLSTTGLIASARVRLLRLHPRPYWSGATTDPPCRVRAAGWSANKAAISARLACRVP